MFDEDKNILSYNDCKDIYRKSVMGKRVVEGLINFALSVDREITIQNAPQEVVDEFVKVSNKMKQTQKIKQTLYNSRIFGTGGLLVNTLKKDIDDKGNITYKPDFRLTPTFDTIKDFNIKFVPLDSMNLSNSQIDNNVLSPTFMGLIDIRIENHKIDNRFIAISHAIDSLYLDKRTDLIPYAPPSVFYNMIDLLNDYDKAIEGLDALLYKSGCFIYKFPSKSKISGATYDAIKTSNHILEQKENGAVISIQNDADINDFPLSNVNGLIEAVNKLEDAITKALNDTPASILFDRRLANGFGDGDKDKETEIQIVNTFRQNKIKPLYDLTDYYVMLCSWTDDFINEIKDKYTDLKRYSNIQLFQKWKEDFVFEFGNLYPEPESVKIENNSKKLDNLLKLQQLGANKSDIEAELNEDRIFKNDIDLDGEAQQFEDEDDKIDYNLYKSIYGNNKKLNRYIDSIIKNDDINNTNKIDEEELTGGKWVTLPNGVHCYIKDGKIVAGADYEKRLSGGEYERESALNPNYVRMKKDITKLGEDIKYFKERLKENPNSKSFNERLNKAEADLKEYEDIINKHENSDIGRDDAVLYQAYMKAEAELKQAEDIKRKKEEEERLKKEQKKEEAKNKKKEKDENNKVSGKEGTQNKSKKITKNYSISYDNETIEKLNSIGKNWKDKRIYFKELNNGYYDLENKKWVTDSPELTEKGLLLAGETDEEKTVRLEAEKQAIEKREAEKQAKKEEAEKKSYDSRLKMQDAISKTEDKDILKTLKDMGVFEANLKFPSIREFAKKLWGFDIDELTKNDKYEVNDRIFNKIKTEMKYMQSLTSPSWQGWLKNYKAKESAEVYEAKQLEYNMGVLGKDPFDDYLSGDYNNGWNRGDSEANKVLWNKYKNEYEEYKRSNKAAQDGHERLKEYLSKYDINIDSKVFVDSLIDLNNYIDKEDADITLSEEEINNDIEYYIDSVKEYIDAKKKEFKESDTEWVTLDNGEHILVNKSTGEVIKGAGGSLNKSKDNDKSKDKKDNDKRKLKKIDFDNIKNVNNIKEVERAEETLNKFYHKTLNYDKDYLRKEMRNHLKYLDMEGNTGALFNNIRKRIEDALNDKSNMASAEDIKKAISKLPKAQQSSAELIYNNIGSKKAKELFSKYEQTIDELKLKKNESKTGAAKRKVYRELTDGAKAMYGFSSINDYKFYKEGRDKEIINLINNNPNPPATVYRGEGFNNIAFKNIQIGQSYFEIKQNNTAEENYGKDIEIKDVNSSNASYDMGTAFEFADESAGTKVVHVFENTKNISSVSYYDYENECFIDKREQILYDIYKGNDGVYYLMYQPKN